jgi:hypothetical protein
MDRVTSNGFKGKVCENFGFYLSVKTTTFGGARKGSTGVGIPSIEIR